MAKHQGVLVGYRRVSSVDQNLARQLAGVKLAKSFEDKVSGSTTDRPGLRAALEYLREGDTLIVHSMDRLARSLRDLLKLVSDLTARGVHVRFFKEGLEFSSEGTPLQKLQLHIMGAVAEFERSMIHERQREGIAAAKAAGKHCGRRSILPAEERQEIFTRAVAGESVRTLAEEYKVSKSTIANIVQAQRKPAKKAS